tara:strand:- start:191 stop:424 length:234 start_codon:yes stop_codon:yes gene_type:complete
MNKQRRKQLKEAFTLINDAKAIIEAVANEEQETIDAMPEGLQDGEQCQGFEENVAMLDSQLDALECVVDEITETCNI